MQAECNRFGGFLFCYIWTKFSQPTLLPVHLSFGALMPITKTSYLVLVELINLCYNLCYNFSVPCDFAPTVNFLVWLLDYDTALPLLDSFAATDLSLFFFFFCNGFPFIWKFQHFVLSGNFPINPVGDAPFHSLWNFFCLLWWISWSYQR